MKAVLCKEYGPPNSLVVEDIAPPSLNKGQVRVKVRACGVNFPDVLIIEGKYQFQPPMPFSPGSEVAGEITEIGPGVTEFAVGDRVIGMPGFNGYREELALLEGQCVRMPANMDFATGAGFAMTYGTGYHGLVDRGRLQEGETLVVHGASGGVGTAAVDIGLALGAKVIATGGDDAKLARLQELYAVEAVVNYRTEKPLKERIKALTSGRGADVIYDPVGGDVFDQSLRCINWGGRLLVVGFASGTIPSAPANLPLLKCSSIVGVFWGSFASRFPEESHKNFETLLGWYEAGKLKPHISHRFPLENAADALQAIIDRQVIGKAVLAVGD